MYQLTNENVSNEEVNDKLIRKPTKVVEIQWKVYDNQSTLFHQLEVHP